MPEEETIDDLIYTITYEDVVVTAEYLRQLNAEMKAADIRAKYGLFRSRLFYGNLRRWQRQGWHCIYTNCEGSEHCTCGLVVHENGTADQKIRVVISPSVQENLKGIELEEIHLARGHKGLPSLKGETVALIVNFVYKEDIDDYLWTAICQECSSFEVEVKNSDAKLFVKTHNKSCGLVPSKKKGR